MIIKRIRWLLTLLLIYGVYTETGPWTAAAIFTISVAIAIIEFEIARIKFVTGGIMAMIFKDDFAKGEFPDFIKKEDEHEISKG